MHVPSTVTFLAEELVGSKPSGKHASTISFVPERPERVWMEMARAALEMSQNDTRRVRKVRFWSCNGRNVVSCCNCNVEWRDASGVHATKVASTHIHVGQLWLGVILEGGNGTFDGKLE